MEEQRIVKKVIIWFRFIVFTSMGTLASSQAQDSSRLDENFCRKCNNPVDMGLYQAHYKHHIFYILYMTTYYLWQQM